MSLLRSSKSHTKRGELVKIPSSHENKGGNLFKMLGDLGMSIAKNPDLAKQIGSTAVDILKIGKNTKSIIDNIKKKTEISQDVQNVVDKIHRLQVGRGGKGFAYA